MRNGEASIRLRAANLIPVRLEFQASLAVDSPVNANAFVRHISACRVDDDIVLAECPVARLNALWANVGDGRVDERYVWPVEGLEPAQV